MKKFDFKVGQRYFDTVGRLHLIVDIIPHDTYPIKTHYNDRLISSYTLDGHYSIEETSVYDLVKLFKDDDSKVSELDALKNHNVAEAIYLIEKFTPKEMSLLKDYIDMKTL